MSDAINTGGPAFPMTSSTGHPDDGIYCQNGMTLRDWFAGMALAGLMARPDNRSASGTSEQLASWGLALLSNDAKLCFKYADAMIAERERVR